MGKMTVTENPIVNLTPSGDAVPHTMRLHFFGPATGKTPWWARRANLLYTHCSVQLGEYMVDMPVNGRCDLYHAFENLSDRMKEPREWRCIEVTALVKPHTLLAATDYLMGLKHQRIRTMLYHLRLWPKRPINCLTPARILLAVFGLYSTGKTPDEIYRQLADHSLTTAQESD